MPPSDSSTLSLLSILVLGFVLGMRHATDADHVVAVSTIVSRERRIGSAAWIGGLWGMGHTLTIVAVGAGIILFTLVIPPRAGLSMEFCVGLMLVLLGGINLRGMWSTLPSGKYELACDGAAIPPGHEIAHQSVGRMDRWLGGWTIYQWLRPLIVGLVHGMAGSAAVALLVLTTMHDPRWTIAYLLVFGVGTIAGMMVITVAMASALHVAGARSAWIHQRLALATGMLSVAFGLLVMYRMGIVHGLFTSHPNWIPE